MWICTPFGILMPGTRPKNTIEAGDKRTLQVRAREKTYLDTFRKRYCPKMGKSIHFPDHDYPWKAYVDPMDLAYAVGKMTLDIDYERFKPQTATRHGLANKAKARRLHSCYNEMWSTQLKYGDGTSKYDKPLKPDPERCKRLGCWWPRGTDKCTDCGKPRPQGMKDDDAASDPQTGEPFLVDEKSAIQDPPDGFQGHCPECGAAPEEAHQNWCLEDDEENWWETK